MAYNDDDTWFKDDPKAKPQRGEGAATREARLDREARNRAKKKYKPKHLRDLGRERK